MSLRPYQRTALDCARGVYERGMQSSIICMPTGTGKTRTAIAACMGHAQLGGECLFVTPRRELRTQARAEMARQTLDEDVGCYVRTIQELIAPGANVPKVSMVVLDEARHYVADEWSRLRDMLPDAIYLGLDATPERGDGRGLGGMFDAIVEAISVRDAIAQGYLVPFEIVRPARALGPGELAQDPVDAYLEHANGLSAVLFAGSVDLAADYAARLRERGVEAATVWGDMPDVERDVTLEQYNAGRIKVLCNVQLLTEGWDAPRTEAVILAGPCGTVGGYLQRVGRGLRTSEGKTKCLIVDVKGLSHTFGDPDEHRTWHLDGRACRRDGDDVEVRFCPVCGAPTATKECEQCGYAGELRKRKPRVLGLPMQRFAREHAMPDDEAAKALASLMGVAQRKNYKAGWAFRIFQHKYGRPVTHELKRAAMRYAGSATQ